MCRRQKISGFSFWGTELPPLIMYWFFFHDGGDVLFVCLCQCFLSLFRVKTFRNFCTLATEKKRISLFVVVCSTILHQKWAIFHSTVSSCDDGVGGRSCWAKYGALLTLDLHNNNVSEERCALSIYVLLKCFPCVFFKLADILELDLPRYVWTFASGDQRKPVELPQDDWRARQEGII